METGDACASPSPPATPSSLCRKTDVGNGMQYVEPTSWIARRRALHHPGVPGSRPRCTARISRRCRSSFVDAPFPTWSSGAGMEDGKTDLEIWPSCSTRPTTSPLVRHPEPGKLHRVSFLLGRCWREGAACRRHDIDEQGVHRHRADPPWRDPRYHHLRLRSVGEPLRRPSVALPQPHPDYAPSPDLEEVTKSFYHDRKLNERFLTVVS